MKVVIPCGGFGTRLREETGFVPKTSVGPGGRALLWRMDYAGPLLGFEYCRTTIKEYFLNNEAMGKHLTKSLGEKSSIKTHGHQAEPRNFRRDVPTPPRLVRNR